MRTCQVIGLAMWLTAGSSASAEDWPHWRGPNYNGVVSEPSGWDGRAWPPGEVAWTGKVGFGASAPVVAEGRLFTLGSDGKQDSVHALDAETGKSLWTQSYPSPRYGRHSEGDKGLYQGPSASPAYDRESGYLFTLGVDGDLNCWDTRDGGRRVWGLNFYDEYDVPQRPKVGRRQLRDYGYTAGPLVWGEWVIAEVGDDEGNLIAFAKRTGERQWTSESTDPAGHTGGPVPITVDGLPCVAVLTIRNLVVARLDEGHEGRTLAEYPYVTDFANSIATPAVHEDTVVLTSEYNQYSISKLKVTRDGITQLWKQPYASGVCSPVIYHGHVYWIWRGVYCLDFETGKPKWRGGLFGDTGSCLVTGDGRLIVWADRGKLVLVETAARSPDRYTELARQEDVFKKDVWPHIVLAGGRLYCKDQEGNLKCFKL